MPSRTLFLLSIVLLQFLRANLKLSKTGRYPGDLLLGGLFPIRNRAPNGHCDANGSLYVDGMYSLEAFYFSLDLLNVRLNKSCGFTLGAITHDTCMSEKIGLKMSLNYVKNRLLDQQIERSDQQSKGELDIIGVVGPMSSAVTVQVALLLTLFKVPQISYGATTPVLSNSHRYPYFFRTVPSDKNQAFAIVEILKRYRWSYVIGVYEDSQYGSQGFQALESLALKNDICFGHKWKIDIHSGKYTDEQNLSVYINRLKMLAVEKPKAKAVVMYLTEPFAHRLLNASRLANLQDHFVWIGSDGWGSRYVPEYLKETVEGAIATHPAVNPWKQFHQHMKELKPKESTNERNPWLQSLWEQTHQCSFEKNAKDRCDTKNKSLMDKLEGTEFGFMHFVKKAVFHYGKALQALHGELCKSTRGLCLKLQQTLTESDSTVLSDKIKNLIYNGNFVRLDGLYVVTCLGSSIGNTDGEPIYSVMNFQFDPNRKHKRHWVETFRVTAENNQSELEPAGVQARYRPDRDSVLYKHTVNETYYYRSFPKSQCGEPCGANEVRRYESDKCCWSCAQCKFHEYKYNESHCMDCPIQYLGPGKTNPIYYKPNIFKNGCIAIDPFVIGFGNPFVIGLAVTTSLVLLFTIATFTLLIVYSNTPIIKASGRELSVVLLVGISLCLVNVFLIMLPPNIFICACVRFMYGVSYTVCYAAILVKTNRIARIFRVTRKGPKSGARRTKYISPLSQIFICALIITFQCVLNVVWLCLRNPTQDTVREIDVQDQTIIVYQFCEAFEDADMIVALVVPALLLILTAIYAFKARKCPGRFNETRFIIITTYTTCIVWLAFVPVFFATKKIIVRQFALCAGLVLHATVTLSCLFIPKLYVVLFRPHKNTKDNVMGKKSISSLGNEFAF